MALSGIRIRVASSAAFLAAAELILSGCDVPVDLNLVSVKEVEHFADRVPAGSSAALGWSPLNDDVRHSLGKVGVAAYPRGPEYAWRSMVKLGGGSAAGGTALGGAAAIACVPTPYAVVSCPMAVFGAAAIGTLGGGLVEAEAKRRKEPESLQLPRLPSRIEESFRNEIVGQGRRHGFREIEALPSVNSSVRKLDNAERKELASRGFDAVVQVAIDGVFPFAAADDRVALLILVRVELARLSKPDDVISHYVAYRSFANSVEVWQAHDGLAIGEEIRVGVRDISKSIADYFFGTIDAGTAQFKAGPKQ